MYRFWRGTVDDKDPTPLGGFNKVFVHEQMGDRGGALDGIESGAFSCLGKFGSFVLIEPAGLVNETNELRRRVSMMPRRLTKGRPCHVANEPQNRRGGVMALFSR